MKEAKPVTNRIGNIPPRLTFSTRTALPDRTALQILITSSPLVSIQPGIHAGKPGRKKGEIPFPNHQDL
jgi:hypothetical protein